METCLADLNNEGNLALNAMTLGIAWIYYGSGQCFDGQGDSDRYLRESMFDGEFGAFLTWRWVEVPSLDGCGTDWSVSNGRSAEWEGSVGNCSSGGFCDF